MKKGLIITAGLAGATLIASQALKARNKSCENQEQKGEEVSLDESVNNTDIAEVKPELKKTKNHNENTVRVHNSLISIKIKVLSK